MIRLAPALAALLLAAPAGAAALDVAMDHARIVRIDREAATIIIGNPSIVDASVHDARTVILTGRSYGSTNVVILDEGGAVLLDENVTVTGDEANSVRVYRQEARTTYSCAPRCEPRVAIGDADMSFSRATGQFGAYDQMSKPQ